MLDIFYYTAKVECINGMQSASVLVIKYVTKISIINKLHLYFTNMYLY